MSTGFTPEHISIFIIIANVIISFKGFNEFAFREKYIFEVDGILIRKEYIRLISSGFLHGGWMHLLFNMYTLYVFSANLGYMGMGVLGYLVLYFVSMLGGDALALYVHRNHGDYRALGASGAVSGVIFASIALFPQGEISFIYPPIPIPNWIFAIGYVLISIYGMRSRLGNIGHDAHLGGAVTGMLIGLAYNPSALTDHPWIILGVLLPTATFLYLLITRPEMMFVPGYFRSQLKDLTSGFKNKSQPKPRMQVKRGSGPSLAKGGRKTDRSHLEEELNQLLEKVNQGGLESLSRKERERLEELSRDLD
ncbi:MAG: rhomboid family intramembrane serine protease [Bacteroidetes bacterium]|nr:rhomboid family intramembrane serine protease [Bacteroidota bacterium]MCB0853403.1 rhomboid family intramembrane serine protease [Bacteroidota bacterium]